MEEVRSYRETVSVKVQSFKDDYIETTGKRAMISCEEGVVLIICSHLQAVLTRTADIAEQTGSLLTAH